MQYRFFKVETLLNNYACNPILSGLFESKFYWGGGGVNFRSRAPKGPIAAKFCMDVKTHVKNIAIIFLPKTVY